MENSSNRQILTACSRHGTVSSKDALANLHHVGADPDPTFHFDADPDPAFNFDADP
jgi:hypothetical protein